MLGQTTLGIDISKEQISVALLSQTNKGIELLRSGSMPMPEGIISEGNIRNPQLLAKCVKEVCGKNKIPICRAVVSLAVKPAIIRVMELPKDLPGNPTQFVKDELKHYAVMSGKSIVHDFCAIGPHRKTKASRLLCGASDEDKITELIKVFNRAGINIKAIEHPIISSARLVFAKHIAKKFNTNVLIAVCHDSAVTLCVFSDANLDFIHSFEIQGHGFKNEETTKNLLAEIAAVKQYYDVEIDNASRTWEIILVSEEEKKDDQFQQSLRSGLSGTKIRVVSFSSLQEDTQIIINPEANYVSPVSVGLAMKYFKTGLIRSEINLFPAGADEIHHLQKFALTTAAVAIIAFILSFGTVPLVQLKIDKVSKLIEEYKQQQSSEDTTKLVAQMAGFGEKAKELSSQTEALAAILESSDSERNWAKLLADISSRTPKTVRITNLTSKDGTNISLIGEASSYDTINKFVKLLDRSPYVSSATLVKSEFDPIMQNLLLYNITCTFAKGNTSAD